MKAGKYIKAERKAKGLTQKELAEKANISRSYLADLEQDRYNPSLDTLFEIATALGISVYRLMGLPDTSALNDVSYDLLAMTAYDNGLDAALELLQKQKTMVPVLGDVAAGLPMYAEENIIDYEELSPDIVREGDELFGLRIKGRSMEPRMLDGDVVIVRKQEDVDNGDIAVVLVNGDSATVKKIKKGPDGLMLIPNNPAFEPMFYSNEDIQSLPVAILGKVVELRGKF